MANINISNLTEKTTINDNDVLLVEDSSTTNKVTKANLLKEVNTKLNNKVDKVSGKGLSTNDYTTAEKEKLAGIAENANNYSLPMATNLVLGGVKISASDPNLQISGGVLSCKKNIPDTFALPKLTKVDDISSDSELAAVITAFNNLIADLKAKEYMSNS